MITFYELTRLLLSSHGKWDNLKNKLTQFSNKWTKLKKSELDDSIVEIFIIKNRKIYSDSDQYIDESVRFNFKSKRDRIQHIIKNQIYIDGIFAYGATIIMFYITKYNNRYSVRLFTIDDDIFEFSTESFEIIKDIKKMIFNSFKNKKTFNHNIINDIWDKYPIQ